jgi:signal transduction histidine kinase
MSIQRVKEVKRLLRRMEVELRNPSHELRPIALDRLGLKPALQFLGDGVARRARIPISVGGDDPRRLPAAIEIGLYRIACTVRDDGIGVAAQPGQGRQAVGLLLIRERLNALNGTLNLTSTPGIPRGH